MKILLTGATGFLGSKILKRLLQQKEKVAVLKRSTSDIRRIRECVEQCSLYDIDQITLDSVFEAEHPEVIIHCAAAYGRSEREAVQVAETNLMFGIRLLSLAEQYGCECFINTGTFACKQIEPEGKIDKPIYMADYTLSKYQFIRWGEAFAARGGLCFLTMDLEHIFGEDDDEGKFIRMLEQKCTSGEGSVELSDGMQLRDYIYTEDVVDAYMCVLEHRKELKGFQRFQVGMGEAITLKEFVIMIKEITKSSISLEFGKRPRNHNEPACSVADISGLKKLGWQPKFSRREGIAEMVRRDKGVRRICRLSLAEGRKIYYDRLVKDFPACEVKPWDKIEQFIKEGLYEMFGMWEGEVLLAYGFVAMDVHKKHLLMDYFAVNEDLRGKGYGQYFLAHLWDIYPNAQGMVFEVEDAAEAENVQEKILRERRIHFYEKAGLQIYPVHAKVYDACYQLMFFDRAGKMPETEAVIESYKAVYQMMMGAEKMTKYMEILRK